MDGYAAGTEGGAQAARGTEGGAQAARDTEGGAQAAFAATLVDEWVRAGLSDAVIAPGSRSTPLALALAEDGRMRLHIRLDERAAGFLALGLSRATERATVVVTTSGTASAELHPAVAEADLAGVPMVVCTADRPPELQGVGAPQTMVQTGLYGSAVRWAVAVAVPERGQDGMWRSLAARAVAEAGAGPSGPGPVHLNLAFRAPLVARPGPLPPGRPDGRPWHHVSRPVLTATPADVAAVADGHERGVLLVGAGAGDPAAVHAAAAALGWPVLADPRSGARTPGPGTVAAADAILRSPHARDQLRPDVVVHLGERWASRAVADWLRQPGIRHVLVDPDWRWRDPDRLAATVLRTDPTALCRAVAEAVPEPPAGPEWRTAWVSAEATAQAAMADALDGRAGLTEPRVARTLFDALPTGATLVVGSSMPVRDLEWFAAPRHRPPAVLANRGVNGIDGTIATALGVAAARRPVAVLLGDLTFLHDAGALLGAAEASPDVSCTLVVVDNHGGGIFSFLPQASHLPEDTFELLFGTPQAADVCAVAAAYGVGVVRAADEGELRSALKERVGSPGVSMIHLRTDRAANVAVHDQTHRTVARALEEPWTPR
ncbi:2-succinyl-5-enolpyruvyl-6-hydroxy-3-cyclohexene-1-carboxylic-acid synthase [Streptomyces sp. MK37H]|nr:2-succinyl-5-enolpyruvyl-6-hydroxy-3-cyclohexene-1-carboxylic-acid synthase [Streptomyces sp. MK37H]